ncbi:MAG TPA: hypothetical protein PLK67_13950, partial [Bryobacteraceae bacterium]|nr:hypothetical protein [Bryobacteraceae bacterium]
SARIGNAPANRAALGGFHIVDRSPDLIHQLPAAAGEKFGQRPFRAPGLSELDDRAVMAQSFFNERFKSAHKALLFGVIRRQAPQVPDRLTDLARRRVVRLQVGIVARGGKTARGAFHVGETRGEIVQLLDNFVAVLNRVRSTNRTDQTAVSNYADSSQNE